MNEQRYTAYLTLINTLLTCPGGEEGRVLQDKQLFRRMFVAASLIRAHVYAPLCSDAISPEILHHSRASPPLTKPYPEVDSLPLK
ncbi:hypothetical protein [Coleofasciculus sp. E2-BRE-01]|uniref:hypothetical protein n=1 Tax=Coleofasciculus sp. E2-BRE-01 TaxID=3069524 RepID=UPI003303DC0F